MSKNVKKCKKMSKNVKKCQKMSKMSKNGDEKNFLSPFQSTSKGHEILSQVYQQTQLPIRLLPVRSRKYPNRPSKTPGKMLAKLLSMLLAILLAKLITKLLDFPFFLKKTIAQRPGRIRSHDP
jgi:hypothetical protein